VPSAAGCGVAVVTTSCPRSPSNGRRLSGGAQEATTVRWIYYSYGIAYGFYNFD